MVAETPFRFSGRPSPRSAFTLIELLTVIAIIGILAAIVIPVVGRVRASAHSAQCVSNLRQVFLSYSLYTNENRDRIPIGFASAADQQTYNLPYAGGWIDYYMGVVPLDQQAIFGCPVQRANKSERWAQSPTWSKRPFPRTYGLNSRLNQRSEGAPRTLRRLSDFTAPARTLLIGDGDNSDNNGDTDYYNSGLAPGRYPEPVHSGKGNVVYLDGHVSGLAKTEVPNTAPVNSEAHLFWFGVHAP